MRFTTESIDEVAAWLLAMDEHGVHVPEADLDRTRRIMANDEPHYGDCTKAPSTCVRCVAEAWREAAEKLVELLVPIPETGRRRIVVEAVESDGVPVRDVHADRSSLIDRISRDRGRDTAIDADLMSMLYVQDRRSIGAEVETENGWAPSKDVVWVDPVTDRWVSTHPLEFTGDVVRALGFADRICPDAEVISLLRSAKGSPRPHRVEIEGRSGPCIVEHMDMPRAILIAALRASVE